MKICFLGKNDLSVNTGNIFLRDAFISCGAQVLDINQDHLKSGLSSRHVERLLRQIEQFNPDFLFPIKIEYINYQIFELFCQKYPIVYYFNDGLYKGRPNFKVFLQRAKASKLVFSASDQACYYFSQVNPHTYKLREASSPVYVESGAKAELPSQRPKDVIFAGSSNSYRDKHVSLLLNWSKSSNRIMDLFGYSHCFLSRSKFSSGARLDQFQLSKKVLDYKIALNLFYLPDYDYISERNFNFMGTKTPIISYRGNEISDLFKEDEEMIFFGDENELVEKIDYYLQHTDELDRIAMNAYNLVVKKHQWIHRAKQVLDIVNHLKDVVFK